MAVIERFRGELHASGIVAKVRVATLLRFKHWALVVLTEDKT